MHSWGFVSLLNIPGGIYKDNLCYVSWLLFPKTAPQDYTAWALAAVAPWCLRDLPVSQLNQLWWSGEEEWSWRFGCPSGRAGLPWLTCHSSSIIPCYRLSCWNTWKQETVPREEVGARKIANPPYSFILSCLLPLSTIPAEIFPGRVCLRQLTWAASEEKGSAAFGTRAKRKMLFPTCSSNLCFKQPLYPQVLIIDLKIWSTRGQ